MRLPGVPLFLRILEALAIFLGLLVLSAATSLAIAHSTGLLADLEETVIRFTWPPLLALAALLVFTTWRPPLPSRYVVALAGLAWLLSAAAYGVREGLPNRAEDVAAGAIVTAAPVTAFLLFLQVVRHLRYHRLVEAAIGGFVALVLSWVAAFLGVAIGCAAPGACP